MRRIVLSTLCFATVVSSCKAREFNTESASNAADQRAIFGTKGPLSSRDADSIAALGVVLFKTGEMSDSLAGVFPFSSTNIPYASRDLATKATVTVLPDAYLRNPAATADRKLLSQKSPLEKLQYVLSRVDPSLTNLKSQFLETHGRAESPWWAGLCDFWSSANRDRDLTSRIGQPLVYDGVYFSVADLRELAVWYVYQEEKAYGTLRVSRGEDNTFRHFNGNWPLSGADLLKVIKVQLQPKADGFALNLGRYGNPFPLDSRRQIGADEAVTFYKPVVGYRLKLSQPEQAPKALAGVLGALQKGEKLWRADVFLKYVDESAYGYSGQPLMREFAVPVYLRTGADGAVTASAYDFSDKPDFTMSVNFQRKGRVFSKEISPVGRSLGVILSKGVPVK